MLQSLLKVSLHKPGREMILYESTLDICSCIRWAESTFAKRIWTLYILCIFNLQRIEENRDKQEEPAWRSFNLKKRKKKFQGKKPQSGKIFTASHKLQMFNGESKKILCCVSTVASTSILPAAARHPCLVGKKIWQVGWLGTSQQWQELNLPWHSSDMHQAQDWKVLESSQALFLLYFHILSDAVKKKIPTKSD